MNIDLSGQPGDWVPQFQPPAPAPPQPREIVAIRGPDTTLHFVLTLLTCGAWLPVWVIVAITGKRRIEYRK
jgi:hypothetical protein